MVYPGGDAMTPQKAIQLLKQRQAEDRPHAEADLYKAQQLGLEALELVSSFQHDDPTNAAFYLPSEQP